MGWAPVGAAWSSLKFYSCEFLQVSAPRQSQHERGTPVEGEVLRKLIFRKIPSLIQHALGHNLWRRDYTHSGTDAKVSSHWSNSGNWFLPCLHCSVYLHTCLVSRWGIPSRVVWALKKKKKKRWAMGWTCWYSECSTNLLGCLVLHTVPEQRSWDYID